MAERGVARERSFDFGRARRLGEQVALHFIAGVVAEKGELEFRLHTLRGNRFAEAAAECDDCFDDGVSVGFGTDVTHERLVDFDAVEGEMLEVAEAGIAGAEVVDGEMDPHLRHLAQGLRNGDLRGIEEDALGDLEFEGGADEMAVIESALDQDGEVGLSQLDGGEVDGDPEMPARPHPGLSLATGLAQDSLAERHNEPRRLGARDEAGRGYRAATGVPPADQCFDTSDAPVSEGEDGLIEEFERAMLEDLTQT